MTNPKDIKPVPSYQSVNRSINNLMTELAQEKGAQPDSQLAETGGSGLERLLKIYRGVGPLLKVISVLPIIPRGWRAALAVFVDAIEGVASIAEFKAGKDL